MSTQDNLNPVQFYHGTNAELSPGAHIVPGKERETYGLEHAYATPNPEQARRYAGMKAADKEGSSPHVYQVTGDLHPGFQWGEGQEFKTKGHLRVVGEV